MKKMELELPDGARVLDARRAQLEKKWNSISIGNWHVLDMIGLIIAFLAISAAHLTGIPELDGIGSVLIGLVLAATAMFLARESKALLIGETAVPEVETEACRIAAADMKVRPAIGGRYYYPDLVVSCNEPAERTTPSRPRPRGIS